MDERLNLICKQADGVLSPSVHEHIQRLDQRHLKGPQCSYLQLHNQNSIEVTDPIHIQWAGIAVMSGAESSPNKYYRFVWVSMIFSDLQNP